MYLFGPIFHFVCQFCFIVCTIFQNVINRFAGKLDPGKSDYYSVCVAPPCDHFLKRYTVYLSELLKKKQNTFFDSFI